MLAEARGEEGMTSLRHESQRCLGCMGAHGFENETVYSNTRKIVNVGIESRLKG